jgi:hypothetical protein
MALTQTLTTSFKAELMLAVHDFRPSGGDILKIALYTSSATLDANTTSYTSSDEVVGTGYTAGGQILTNQGVTTSPNTASSGVGYTDFADVTWADATITARGALIYNSTPSALSNSGLTLTNPAIAVLDFGSDKSSSTGDFTISFPTASNTAAIIRIA